MPEHLNRALKEWDFVCRRLVAGEQSILIRKGGIREIDGLFRVDDGRFLLMPGIEHQKKELLRPEYHAELPSSNSAGADNLEFAGWAEIDEVLVVKNPSQIFKLDEFHPWNERYLNMRLNFNPYDPLYVLILRCFRFPEMVAIPNRPDYGGCSSWVTLFEGISIADSQESLSLKDHQLFRDRFIAAWDENVLRTGNE